MGLTRFRIDSVKELQSRKTVEELQTENDELKGRIDALEAQVDALKAETEGK